MKKVLIAAGNYPPDYTGAGLRASRLVERLNKKYGLHFLILCVRHNNAVNADDEKLGITRLNLVEETGMLFPLHIIQAAFLTNFYLWKHRKEIDVIHFFSFPWVNRIIMFLNILLYNKKTMLEVTLDGSDDPQSLLKIGLRNKLLGSFTIFLLNRINRFLVPSKNSVRSCLNAGIHRDNIWLRPHPVDESFFGSIPFEEKNRLRKKLGLPNKFILLNAGMIYPRKNQLFLIKMIKLLRTKNVLLVLIGPKQDDFGSSQYYELLQNYVHKHNMKNVVFFAGEKKNLNEYAIASDLLVFASKSEGFPNVVAETLTAGLPFVSLQISGLEQIADSKIGIMIDRKNKSENQIIVEFAKNVDAVANGSVHFSRHKIRKKALDFFSARKIDKGYYMTYNDLVKKEDR